MRKSTGVVLDGGGFGQEFDLSIVIAADGNDLSAVTTSGGQDKQRGESLAQMKKANINAGF